MAPAQAGGAKEEMMTEYARTGTLTAGQEPPMSEHLQWGSDRITLTLSIGPEAPVGILALEDAGSGTQAEPGSRGLPMVEILSVSEGRGRSSQRYTETALGSRLRYRGHRTGNDGIWNTVEVTQSDPATGLIAVSHLKTAAGSGALQSSVTLTNHGSTPVHLQAVTSLAFPVLKGMEAARAEDLRLLSGSSQWLGENQWASEPLRRHLPNLNLRFHGQDQRGHLIRSSTSTWSTGGDLPVGALVDVDEGWSWMWQIEHNGGWAWEIAEFRDRVALSLLGPTDEQHQWLHVLAPGESFTTVPATLALSREGLEGAARELTTHRRALRSSFRTVHQRPVVYNDFMNTLMGEPSTERLLPLVQAAAEVGADVFCIDAGWYDDGSDWWDAVGEWAPAAGARFPNGLHEVTDAIRECGMTVGLWLEPEVIGKRSSVARSLPDSAFLQRRGQRVTEHGRHHLDLRDPSARAHLDAAVDRLVGDFNLGYLKFDYNITPGAGTDYCADSPGDGLLGHNLAYLDWLEGIKRRHPELMIENCASGAMRQDYALLSRLDLQSTSDQQDALLYPPIAANSLLSVLPEQAAHWSYPQPEMDEEQIRFTLATGMLGRMYLSGFLDRMSNAQRAMVAEAVSAHKRLLPEIAQGFPFWPAGVAAWEDRCVAVGLHAPERDLVTVWNRRGTAGSLDLHLPRWKGRAVTIDVVTAAEPLPPDALQWDPDGAHLRIALPGLAGPIARTLAISPEPAGAPSPQP